MSIVINQQFAFNIDDQKFGMVNVLMIDDDIWFKGLEIAELLGYVKTRDAIYKHVDEEDKISLSNLVKENNRRVSQLFHTSGCTRGPRIAASFIQEVNNGYTRGPQITAPFTQPETVMINESGMYSLVLRSRLPAAKRFKRWVTSEVLPALRKQGHYEIETASIEPFVDRIERLEKIIDRLQHSNYLSNPYTYQTNDPNHRKRIIENIKKDSKKYEFTAPEKFWFPNQ